MLQALFWFSIFFIFYAYAGYPLLLSILSFFRNRPVRKGDITPTVSFIITAYNEEKRIEGKIENSLKQSYPREKVEIIIASDCSTDRTDEIVKSYQPQGVRLVRAPERRGKEAAQKMAVEASSGEVLVFSDVATILLPDGILNIVRNFSDPTVGCVSSVDRFVDSQGRISGEGMYVQYEMFLRDLETKANTLVGLSGSFFAARRAVCRNWAVDLQSDFNTLLNAIRSGLRGVSDRESIGVYQNILDEKREFDRKVRTVLRGISVFMASRSLLNPFRYGLFSWQLFSHKLCRWLVPFAMISAFLANFFLMLHSTFYLALFVMQISFYAAALGGLKLKLLSKKHLLKVPSFFVLVNLSILNAWYQYIRGERIVLWNPSQR
jgi:glycosyltransferase involved in cell wall biosynthesis